ncbi:MAG: UDP-N-acetylmuramoyl-L-alanyl-D-glutamate--2,6-diaminopimelate ligase [Candidatus Babeliales bacterium]|nr:UDP-N-acetylmuramoyl-L-alanyl-D-glutamate--2,6-diaminopimelate ligase [Candidatus Babeliales bacterium]
MQELKNFKVTCHTDNIALGTTFVAVKGMQSDGINYIPQALAKGASTVVLPEDAILSDEIKKSINTYQPAILRVADCRQALSTLSAQAFNYPAKKLNIIGVTGTKGKTTSAYLLYHLFKKAGYKTALITGVKNYIGNVEYKSELTTPHPDYLHAFFNECVESQVKFVIMEASAQGFSLKRLHDIQFSAGIFTNFDLEHSEFYANMNDYFDAKCEMFKHLKTNAPFVVNVDNAWGKKIADAHPEFTEISQNQFKITKNDSLGLEFTILGHEFSCPNLVGTFNAYNLAGVVTLALQMDIPVHTIQKALLTFSHVPGRMERYKLASGAIAVIDYAHNPSSFSQILPTLRTMTNNLIVVFGCGGSRDKTKRPIMGDIASTIADKVIITSDNPRFEKVEDIIEEIYLGCKAINKDKVKVILDRAQAIELAYKNAQSGSIIAILGKGPDEYEMIGNQKFYFSDKENILKCE